MPEFLTVKWWLENYGYLLEGVERIGRYKYKLIFAGGKTTYTKDLYYTSIPHVYADKKIIITDKTYRTKRVTG